MQPFRYYLHCAHEKLPWMIFDILIATANPSKRRKSMVTERSSGPTVLLPAEYRSVYSLSVLSSPLVWMEDGS